MSFRPISSSAPASSAPAAVNNNKYFSKIIAVALIAIGLIAAYAFLPPVGIKIGIGIVILFVLVAAAKKNQKKEFGRLENETARLNQETKNLLSRAGSSRE